MEDGSLVVATIKEGVNKPYHDNKGIVWVKNGSDKRKVFDTGVGSGITRALDENINVTFTNNPSAQEFVITVWREESNEVEGKSNQVERKSNQVEDLDTRLRHSDTPKVSLSNKQRDIVNFCSVPRTTKEILDRIGVSMHSKNRERYITSLVAAGYLQMTNPENPTASNLKYKKATTK